MEGNMTTSFPTVTIPPCHTKDTSLYVGFIVASLAVVFYGTTFIPVKKFDAGDGNLTVVPIEKMIGLGLGYSIWGVTNLLSGWSTGRFGLFGLKADPLDNLVLNDIGVILAVIRAVIFTAVKNEISSANIDTTVTVDMSETTPLNRNTEPFIEKKTVTRS